MKKIRFKLKLKMSRVMKHFGSIAFLFFLLGVFFFFFLHLVEVKEVKCTGLPQSNNRLISELIKANLRGYPLILVNRPQLEKILQPLQLWQIESFKRKFPSQLNVYCQPRTNRAYLYLENNRFKPPKTLVDWYHLSSLLVGQKARIQHLFLLLFNFKNHRLLVIANPLKNGRTSISFFAYTFGRSEKETIWNVFSWLQELNRASSRPAEFFVFVVKDNALIVDRTRGIDYLLNGNSLPVPAELAKFIVSLPQNKNFLIDWRGKKLVLYRPD